MEWVAEHGKLPVPNFSAGGIATPADAALVMQLGAEAVFVGSGIFKSSDPEARARAIVKAATYFNDPVEAAGGERRTRHGHVRSRYREAARIGAAADARLVNGVVRKKKSRRAGAAGRFRSARKGVASARARNPWKCARPPIFRNIDGLVIPGGESTTMLKLLEEEKLLEPLREFGREHPIFGTCAGAILLASGVSDPSQASLGSDGHRRRAQRVWTAARQPHRAPAAGGNRRGAGSGVHSRAHDPARRPGMLRYWREYQGDPVLVEQGRHLVATFHPELTGDPRVHLMFLEKIA